MHFLSCSVRLLQSCGHCLRPQEWPQLRDFEPSCFPRTHSLRVVITAQKTETSNAFICAQHFIMASVSQQQKHGIHVTLVTQRTSFNEVCPRYENDVCLSSSPFASLRFLAFKRSFIIPLTYTASPMPNFRLNTLYLNWKLAKTNPHFFQAHARTVRVSLHG